MKRALAIATVLAAAFAFAAGKGNRSKEPAPPPKENPAAPAAPITAPSNESESWLSDATGRPKGLTAAQAVERAVDTSKVVRQREADREAAQAVVAAATVGFAPRLLASAHYSRFSHVPDQTLGLVVVAPMSMPGPLGAGSVLVNAPVTVGVPDNQTALQASLVVPLSDYLLKIPQSRGNASDTRDAAYFASEATKRQVALDAKVAYYEWARARLQGLVAQLSLKNVQTHHQSVSRLFDAGAASKADVLAVESQVATAELLVHRVHTQEVVLGERLRTLMHDDGTEPLEIGESLATPRPKTNVGEAAPLVKSASDARLELKAKRAVQLAQGDAVNVARAGYLPRIDAYGAALYANPNPRYFPPKDAFEGTWEIGATLSYSPNEVLTSMQLADAAKAREHAAQMELEAAQDALRVEVTQAVEAVREADQATDSTHRALAAAEEAYRVRRELFLNEHATSTELTDTETQLTQARLNAVSARIDQEVAAARFAHAIGEDK